MTAAAGPVPARTPARRKARQLAKYLRAERPDYAYLKDVFRHLREELGVDLDTCRIRITQGKGGKDPVVPFPAAFKETLALHIDALRRVGAAFLFESSWKKP